MHRPPLQVIMAPPLDAALSCHFSAVRLELLFSPVGIESCYLLRGCLAPCAGAGGCGLHTAQHLLQSVPEYACLKVPSPLSGASTRALEADEEAEAAGTDEDLTGWVPYRHELAK